MARRAASVRAGEARGIAARAAATSLAIGLFLLALFALPGATSATAQPRPDDLVRASLLIEPSAIQAGQPFTVAVRLQMKPHWHTYWRNPGDSGLPTEIRWTLPKGFSAGPIQWPTPERLPVGPLMNFGYEGVAYLLTEITPPADLAPVGQIRLQADASWLVCEKECVPGSASLSASAPAAPATSSVPPAASNASDFHAARAALPTPLAGANFSIDAAALRVTAPLPPELAGAAPGAVAFFPVDESLIDNAAPQTFSVDNGQLSVVIPRAASSLTPSAPQPGHLEGVLQLTADGATRGYAITVGTPPAPVAASSAPHPALRAAATQNNAAAPANAAVAPPLPADTDHLTLITAIILAFAGGVILNLMPCVFPVLSIKVLSLAQGAGKTPGAMRLHGVSYGAGVLAAFAALALALMAARQAGASVGWGFQLQSPVVVAALACVMLAMGLGLSGAAQLGGGLAGIGDRLTRSGGYAGSFFTGILAAVVASPCTGPFMGAAIGFALTQSALVTVAVFLALGAGLAAPFVLLAFVPALVRRLPRPGRWMEILKQALAFPLFATAAWLLWVLSQQVSPIGLALALTGLVAVALALWAGALAASSGRAGSIAARMTAVIALCIAIACIWRVDSFAATPGAAAPAPGVEAFSQQRLDALLEEGRPVFVNLTAAWCITCMVNERTTLDTAAVRDSLKARGVIYMKGDWTNQNPEITSILARFGRGGVPLYLLYRGDRAAPQVLPQILTPGLVVDALDALPLRTAADGAGAAGG